MRLDSLSVSSNVPWLRSRVHELQDWKQCSLLAVESDRLPRWYRPGLLLIGDAAHVMSPIGGNGINYAVQDAAAAANLLSEPLKAGRVSVPDLAAVQRRRDWPTRITQAVVTQIQDRVIRPAIRGNAVALPLPPVALRLLRAPLVQRLVLTWIAYGLWPVHLSRAVRLRASRRPTGSERLRTWLDAGTYADEQSSSACWLVAGLYHRRWSTYGVNELWSFFCAICISSANHSKA